jgi:hypothetical protein
VSALDDARAILALTESVHHSSDSLRLWYALAALVAEQDRLRAAIEDYLLWEPGRKGHAVAHARLAASLDAGAGC